MQIKQSGTVELYEVTSRLIIGGRVYLPGTTVKLDTADGEALLTRGFLRKPKVIAAHQPNVEKEPALKPAEVGVVTKDEQSHQMEQPMTPVVSPDNEREPVPESSQAPAKESTNHGKPARRNR